LSADTLTQVVRRATSVPSAGNPPVPPRDVPVIETDAAAVGDYYKWDRTPSGYLGVWINSTLSLTVPSGALYGLAKKLSRGGVQPRMASHFRRLHLQLEDYSINPPTGGVRSKYPVPADPRHPTVVVAHISTAARELWAPTDRQRALALSILYPVVEDRLVTGQHSTWEGLWKSL
jgi:hypothetical protein